VAQSFATFHQQFAPLFGRTEARQRSEQHLRGGCWSSKPTAATPRTWPRSSRGLRPAPCNAS
jgi:hypothetical protein